MVNKSASELANTNNQVGNKTPHICNLKLSVPAQGHGGGKWELPSFSNSCLDSGVGLMGHRALPLSISNLQAVNRTDASRIELECNLDRSEIPVSSFLGTLHTCLVSPGLETRDNRGNLSAEGYTENTKSSCRSSPPACRLSHQHVRGIVIVLTRAG
jgi:hypothetical protein